MEECLFDGVLALNAAKRVLQARDDPSIHLFGHELVCRLTHWQQFNTASEIGAHWHTAIRLLLLSNQKANMVADFQLAIVRRHDVVQRVRNVEDLSVSLEFYFSVQIGQLADGCLI